MWIIELTFFRLTQPFGLAALSLSLLRLSIALWLPPTVIPFALRFFVPAAPVPGRVPAPSPLSVHLAATAGVLLSAIPLEVAVVSLA